MAGIFGFQSSHPVADHQIYSQKMMSGLINGETDRTSNYSDDQTCMGCVQFRSTPFPEQPFWNSDQSIGVLVAGEIFGYEDQKTRLRRQGYRVDENNIAQFIACLYQEQGENFVCSLNGSFAVVIWDARRQELIIANDRLGFEPLYYYHERGFFAFSSGFESLSALPEVGRNINRLAIGQFLTFGHVLGEGTYLQDINLLPPASILVFKDARVYIENYWRVHFPQHYKIGSENEHKEQLLFLLRQAVQRQKPDNRSGILLSGGTDSRVLLALLCEDPLSRPVSAYTFGDLNCDDNRYAREIAAKLNIPHQFFQLKPDYLSHVAEQGVRITGGMANPVDMHSLANLSAQAEQTPLIYKGFLGDTLTHSHFLLDRDLLARYSPADSMQIFLKRYPLVFSPTDQDCLFSDDFRGQLQDDVTESVRDVLFYTTDDYNLAVETFFQFNLYQRQRRFTLNGVQLVRSQAITRTPFYDNDLLDFVLDTPQSYRFEGYLIYKILTSRFPELAKVPLTGFNYPLLQSFRELFMRMDDQVCWRLRASRLNIPVRQSHPYANYDEWFRGPLRTWIEDLLLKDRFMERGYFKKEFIQKLLQEHRAGANQSRKLGALIAVELWHQNFID